MNLFPSQPGRSILARMISLALCLLVFAESFAQAAPPSPVLNSVFPPGGQAGTSVVVTVAGSNLMSPMTLRSSLPQLTVESVGPNQCRLTIPKDALPGQYDLQALTANGLSSIRTFVVGNRNEQLELEPNNSITTPQIVPLDVVINGRIERGDLDQFSFTARRGQRVIIECQAERIDSRLRAVLELHDASGRRLAVNRGWYGVDPLLDFLVPADGNYVVKLFDLVYSGSAEHFYRLSIDTGPKVAFTTPNFIERGKTTSVTVHGWNLGNPVARTAPTSLIQGTSSATHPALDAISVEITPPNDTRLESLRLRSNQVGVDGFAYLYPGADAPVLMGISDVPVVLDHPSNHSANVAQEVSVPCEVSGQLVAGDEQDWFAINVRRGDVLWLEAFGERLGSTLDLDLSVLDSSGGKELASFHDTVRANDAPHFPTNNMDPSGRWVAPADGRFLILIRNLTADLDEDPRRQYRLSIRREEPDFQLVAIPRRDESTGLNVARGGSCALDVLAFRRRGLSGGIRVSAKNLPIGMDCPDIWLGPGVDSAPLVINAGRGAEPLAGLLELEGHAESVAGVRKVHSGLVIHKGPTGVASRMSRDVNYSVSGEAALRITANGHEPKKHHLFGELRATHAPGSVLDVVVEVERRDTGHQAPVRLVGIGLPDLIQNQTLTIPAGQSKGTLSFYLPATMPVGKYTFAIQGETTIPTGPKDPTGKPKTEAITSSSNTVTIDVQPAAFVVEVDPFAPKKIRRGEVLQVNYTARRINGFIGKIHTELDAPGEVIGLRGRGVTFVGQTDSGTIQIIASEDAPLGQQPFLRLIGVGVVEDQPVYQGHCFVNLEIVE